MKGEGCLECIHDLDSGLKVQGERFRVYGLGNLGGTLFAGEHSVA